MFHQCTICLDEVFIPVEMTAFHCSASSERNCYSFKRMCLECAVHYLELDRPPSHRSFQKKCLFCDAKASPADFVMSPMGSRCTEGYKKDYLFMSMDPRTLTCKYCKEFTGSHLDMEKHVEKHCGQRPMDCFCGFRGCKIDMESEEHRKTCCFFRECLICRDYVAVNDHEMHLAKEHDMIFCEQCQKPTTLSLEEHKKSECAMRMMECRHCRKSLLANAYMDHLTEHAKQCKLRLALLRDMKNREMVLFLRFSQEIENLFELTYGTPIVEEDSSRRED